MLELISFLIHGIQFFLVPICFVVAWSVIILCAWSLWSAARDSVSKAKQMHQIPCTGCQFFTDNYRLKCTVHKKLSIVVIINRKPTPCIIKETRG
jgi:hypothetical protein